MILRPSQPWPKRLLFHHQPTHQPFRAPPLRGLHAYHIFKYIRKQREKKILNDKKTVIPYHSHHQRTKILPVFKGEQKTKKKRKKDLLLHWSFVFRNMKAGMFSYFFFLFFQRLCILHWYFLCCLNLCISAISLKCVYISPWSFCAFFPHDFSSVLRGHLRKDFLLEFLFPVIHTDVVALHYIENSY